MVKINKNPDEIPDSLNSELTKQRREELIENKGYIDKSIYESRYKIKDIKAMLEKNSHGKCAYCEKDISDSFFHVEHYRPKSDYWWLAYSWDNLLICCDKCNVCKSNKFEIAGEKADFDTADMDNIHNLGERYNEVEKPKMVHPEIEDVEKHLIFDEAGRIRSDDERVQYTIATCEIDRSAANERRKKIWDEFLRRFEDRFYEFKIKKNDIAMKSLRDVISDFRNDSQNPEKEYLAFRRWLIRNTKYFPK